MHVFAHVCECHLCVYVERPEDSVGHLSFSVAAHRIFLRQSPSLVLEFMVWPVSPWDLPRPTCCFELQASTT